MPRIVELNQLPTLRQLYQKLVLRRSSNPPKFPPEASLLDKVSLYQGDITQLDIHAIVNAAKKTLLGGGGVDGAIHRAAGPQLLAECRTLNGCETGNAKITKGYNLPSSHVIHAVGPVYSSSNVAAVAEQLASCYRRSLRLAAENGLKQIAFPSISTGIYGYPIEAATHIALKEVRTFLDSDVGSDFERVVFVVFSDEDKEVYQRLIPLYFPSEA
ncbi:A1pp-domain-containing protein [Dentipellis sp. KUC8613]|nr:A1pp-domain-containing protein [Dentipellis sp. KUC8613]